MTSDVGIGDVIRIIRVVRRYSHDADVNMEAFRRNTIHEGAPGGGTLARALMELGSRGKDGRWYTDRAVTLDMQFCTALKIDNMTSSRVFKCCNTWEGTPCKVRGLLVKPVKKNHLDICEYLSSE